MSQEQGNTLRFKVTAGNGCSASHCDAVAIVGQVVGAAGQLQGAAFPSLISPSRRSIDARNSAGGIVASHQSASAPTTASSSSSPTRTRTAVCARSICEPSAARPSFLNAER
jgi:hypothetical protein